MTLADWIALLVLAAIFAVALIDPWHRPDDRNR